MKSSMLPYTSSLIIIGLSSSLCGSCSSDPLAVVHRTPTAQSDLDNKEQPIVELIEENELAESKYKIANIAWLRDKAKPHCRSASLGIWYEAKEFAEQKISNSLVFGNAYGAASRQTNIKENVP